MRRSQEYQTIKDNNNCVNVDVGSESYSSESDSGSADDSYSDASDMANWEEFVLEDGSLFYVEYMPKDLSKLLGEGKVEFMRNSLRMAKKSSRRQQTGLKPTEQAGEEKYKGNQLMFADIATSEDASKTLELVITAADRFRFGRRSTAVESILGFHVVPFVDQPECLMVDTFVHDMPALFQQGNLKPVSKGDWLKALDNIEIRTSNIDDLLLQFVEPTKVCLKFQGPLKAGDNADNPTGGAEGYNELNKIENFRKFSEMFEKLQNPNENSTTANPELGMRFGLLILPPECYQSDEHKNSLYYYPEDPLNNFLYKARGSFLTLNAVLSEELKTKPSASKLSFDNVQYFVYYRNLNGFLVLFAYPCCIVNLSEGNLRADELLTYIKFMFPHLNLDSFKQVDFRQFMLNFCEIQRVRLLTKIEKKGYVTPLEDVLKESRHLPLPKEAQLRIFDALSEMEAMDYRNWNDEPLHTHREFFIYGSVLYYDHFMLASQMPLDMRQYIEVFMRCRGIFDFVNKHNTKELYVWEEIILPESTGRYFLAICGRGHLVLPVVLKIFTTPDLDREEKVVPSLFYIEEIQETLDHLVQCGIESLAMFWSVSNKRPEILETSILEEEALAGGKEGKKSDAAAMIKQKLHTATSQVGNTKDSNSHSNVYVQRSTTYEEDNQPCSSLGGSSVHSLTPSEDDSSKKRLITSANNEASDDSGSDWENFLEENLLHYNATDVQLQSQVTESLWKEISNVVPVKLSAGWKNNIFYYVYVDGTNNSVFCPLKSSKDTFPFTAEMSLAFHTIHQILQKAKFSKRDSASRQLNGKDIIAVKEHGMTIRVRDVRSPNEGKHTYFTAVGRLFLSPPKEVYICHRPDIPQNMVELAFRLSFFSLG